MASQNQAHPFFLYFAAHDIHVPRVPGTNYRGRSGCGIRGDVIQEFDGGLGAVLDTLDRLKLSEHTLVIVTSDNGGVMDDGYADGAVKDAQGHRCNGAVPGKKGGSAVQLYHLADDLEEKQNLAGTMPERVKEIEARLRQAREQERTRPPDRAEPPLRTPR